MDTERCRLVAATTSEAMEWLGLPADTSPLSCVTAVHQRVVAIQRGTAPPEEKDIDVEIALGCLWGTQVARELGWSWMDIDSDGRPYAIGVVSPSRDMVIYPMNFVHACITAKSISTILLSFNMLRERKGDVIYTASSYENVMQHIHHIVPPEPCIATGLTMRLSERLRASRWLLPASAFPHHAASAPASAVAELGVVRRHFAPCVES